MALALIGFATVADDLNHTGELLAIGSLLFAGIALIVAGSANRLSSRLALQWLAIGLGVGAACGAATDRMSVGVGAGAALGLLFAYLLRRRTV